MSDARPSQQGYREVIADWVGVHCPKCEEPIEGDELPALLECDVCGEKLKVIA